jgi:hypothetical protein
MYGIVTVNYLQEKDYKTKGVYSKTITPPVIAGIEANMNTFYAIHQVSLNVCFTGCASESGDFENVMKSKCFHLLSFNTYEHPVYIQKFRFFSVST